MKKYRIGRNSECLCGSGLKYKNCCLELMHHEDISETIKEIKNKNYELAYKFCQVDLTRYMIYVLSHTEPLLSIHHPMGKKLLDIDIKALSEILDRLMRIIRYGDIEIDFEQRLGNLKNIFYNKDWHFRLNYYKAAWNYFIKDDEVTARNFLLQHVKYDDINDLDFLQMYFDLCSDELTFSKKIEVLDKLITIEERPSGIIQYMGGKAISYFLIGDVEKAKEMFTDAISIAEKRLEEFNSSFDYYQLAKTYHYAGRFQNERRFLEKSLEYFEKTRDFETMNDIGQAMIYSQLGDVYGDLKEYQKALESYLLSLKYANDPLTKIFISQIYLEQEDMENAVKFLSDIDYERLTDKGNKVDYLIAMSKLVITIKDNEKAKFTYAELKKLSFDSKYFSDLINGLKADLLEIYGDFSTTVSVEKSKIKKILDKINKYIIAQPTFFGFGFNFNNLIGDYMGQSKEK